MRYKHLKAFFTAVICVLTATALHAATLILDATGAMSGPAQQWNSEVNIASDNSVYADAAAADLSMYTEFADSGDIGVITGVAIHIKHYETGSVGGSQLAYNFTDSSGTNWYNGVQDGFDGASEGVDAGAFPMTNAETTDGSSIYSIYSAWDWTKINNLGSVIRTEVPGFTIAYVDYVFLEITYDPYTPTVTPTVTQTITETTTQSVSATASPTQTPTNTETGTASLTQTVTETVTATVTETVTATITGTITGTVTPTVTATDTRTISPTVTGTITETVTATVTLTVTGTTTSTITQTGTQTVSSTTTPTVTETTTGTITPTVTESVTETTTDTVTGTITQTSTQTVTETTTLTVTDTATGTVTATVTETSLDTATDTQTVTETITETVTPTVTASATETTTGTVTGTATQTGTPTVTGTVTLTVTETSTGTVTATITETTLDTATDTQTVTQTVTETVTPTVTESITGTITGTVTGTVTQTGTRTVTETMTPTVTETATATITATMTETSLDTATDTRTVTQTVTETVTPTATRTTTRTVTGTVTATMTETYLDTATDTQTITQTVTVSVTPTISQTTTGTVTPSVSATITGTATASVTVTITLTTTGTVTQTVTGTITSSMTQTSTPMGTDTMTPTITPTLGSGYATIDPVIVGASTSGNTMTIEYTAGGSTWVNGTMKIIIPAGWSVPSFTGTAPGYYSVSVQNGTYSGGFVNGNTITVYCSSLTAGIGKITVKYGDKTLLGPGVTAQSGAGTAVFGVEVDPLGTSTSPLDTSPQVSVIVPSATPTVTNTSSSTSTVTITLTVTQSVTPTVTPYTGEGIATANPPSAVTGGTGNTIVLEYTAGPSTWGSGTLEIVIPSGWSAPSRTATDPGYYTVSVSGGSYDGTLKSGQSIIVYASSLAANTGKITVTYGYRGSGGPGATAQGTAGTAVFLVKSDTAGTNPNEILTNPQVIVGAATATVTATPTVTKTITPDATPVPAQTVGFSVNAADSTLSWSTTSNVDYFRVYYATGATGRLNQFPAGWQLIATVLPTPVTSSYTNADSANTYGCYTVTGVNGAGEGSPALIQSKVKFSFTYTPGQGNVYRLSLPYVNKFTKASDIVAEIEGNTLTSAKIDKLYLWNPVTQSSIIYGYSSGLGKWVGTDWSVDAGTSSSNALYMNVLSNFEWVVSGYDKNADMIFHYTASAQNSNKRSMPYTSGYAKASEIVVDIEGGTGSGRNTKINRIMSWSPATQSFAIYGYSDSLLKWVGTDFTIAPGDALNIFLSGNTQDFTWTPKLVLTPVP